MNKKSLVKLRNSLKFIPSIEKLISPTYKERAVKLEELEEQTKLMNTYLSTGIQIDNYGIII